MYQSKLSMRINYISSKAIVQTFNVGIYFGTLSLLNVINFHQTKQYESKRHLVQSKFGISLGHFPFHMLSIFQSIRVNSIKERNRICKALIGFAATCCRWRED